VKKRLAAAIVVVPTLLGGAVITLSGAEVANAAEITVCKREVLGPNGWACVEWTTCLYNSAGSYICSDGTRGGGGYEIVPIAPIAR
jgi:hypothetical protein